MRIGLQIPRFTYPGSPSIPGVLKDVVQAADAGGFYSVWVMDHLFQIAVTTAPASGRGRHRAAALRPVDHHRRPGA